MVEVTEYIRPNGDTEQHWISGDPIEGIDIDVELINEEWVASSMKKGDIIRITRSIDLPDAVTEVLYLTRKALGICSPSE